VQQAFLLPMLGAIAVLAAAVLLPKTPLRTTHHDAAENSGQKVAATAHTLSV
jgi:hypothetical protein